jgi:SAM-dependent methyltransferase
MMQQSVFIDNAAEYDCWYDQHPLIYQSELLAVQQAMPQIGTGIEIGVGSGRFAQPLGIKFGVEPVEEMAKLAEQRNIQVYLAVAEQLPFAAETFDYVLMVTTLCFLRDIPKAFSEVKRILKPEGHFIIGFIDKESTLGKKYEQQKSTSKFYRNAHFHSVPEITSLLKHAGFDHFMYWQTLTKPEANIPEEPQPGFGQGSFVLIKTRKP